MNGGKGEPLVSSLQNCGRGRLCLAQRGSKPLNKSGSCLLPPALHLLPSSPGPPAGRPTRRGCPTGEPSPGPSWGLDPASTPPWASGPRPLSPAPSFKLLPHSRRCWGSEPGRPVGPWRRGGSGGGGGSRPAPRSSARAQSRRRALGSPLRIPRGTHGREDAGHNRVTGPGLRGRVPHLFKSNDPTPMTRGRFFTPLIFTRAQDGPASTAPLPPPTADRARGGPCPRPSSAAQGHLQGVLTQFPPSTSAGSSAGKGTCSRTCLKNKLP